VQYRNLFHHSYVAAGHADDEDLRREAQEAADQVLSLAARWPLGTVLERRSALVAVRTWPPS
jgi:hypothetical protein